MDSSLQARAASAVSKGTAAIARQFNSTSVPEGALVALDSRTGQILALIGGNDFNTSPFNRAVQAKRQPGSVFKPFVYAAAFEKGIPPDFIIEDAPFTIHNPDGSVWAPSNYSKRYYGPTSLTDGLVYSRNIVTIKLLNKTGTKPVIQLARDAGINSELLPELTLALGASPVSLLEMTGAYTIFANNGTFNPPVSITSIRDRHGRKYPVQKKQRKKEVIKPATAEQVTTILKKVISRGTGKKAEGIPSSAGKTGTTDNNMDGWFVGYTSQITTGVWVGFDRGRSLDEKATGGETAAPIWLDFMRSTSK